MLLAIIVGLLVFAVLRTLRKATRRSVPSARVVYVLCSEAPPAQPSALPPALPPRTYSGNIIPFQRKV